MSRTSSCVLWAAPFTPWAPSSMACVMELMEEAISSMVSFRLLYKTGCLAHGTVKRHTVHTVRGDDRGKHVPRTGALRVHLVGADDPRFPVLLVDVVGYKLPLRNAVWGFRITSLMIIPTV